MISYVKSKGKPTQWFGLSTDTKPSYDVGNGDLLIEIDTGKVYFFDAEGDQWVEWGA